MIELNTSKQAMAVYALAVVFCVLALFPNEVNPVLRYSRSEIFEGQFWRLLSAHFAHTNYMHGIMNSGAWLIIMGLVGVQYCWQRWLMAIVAIGTGISLLLLASSDFLAYVGFSGVLHGLICMGALRSVVRSQDKMDVAVLILLVVKIIYEQQPGFDENHLENLIAAPVVVDAHMYGALCGAVIFLVFYCVDYLKSRDRSSNESKVSE